MISHYLVKYVPDAISFRLEWDFFFFQVFEEVC